MTEHPFEECDGSRPGPTACMPVLWRARRIIVHTELYRYHLGDGEPQLVFTRPMGASFSAARSELRAQTAVAVPQQDHQQAWVLDMDRPGPSSALAPREEGHEYFSRSRRR